MRLKSHGLFMKIGFAKRYGRKRSERYAEGEAKGRRPIYCWWIVVKAGGNTPKQASRVSPTNEQHLPCT
jgi:hypothetical protein